MQLTDYEKKMLDGAYGPFKQKAMEFVVRYGNVLDAEELCEVKRATLFVGAQHYLNCYADDVDYEKIFSEFYLCSDQIIQPGKMSEDCDTQTCGACCDLKDFKKSHVPQAQHQRNLRFLEETRKMGVKITDSCTPYYIGWIPLMGEHFMTTESSNVVVSNSVFGAFGNSDGVEAAVCGAITGRTPKWGMHIKENRHGTCLFHIDFEVDSQKDWDILGFTLGRLLPKHEIPIITGKFKRPNIHKLRQFCASIAVTSAAEICHIVGVTPEAQTLEMALGYHLPKYEIHVTKEDFDESYAMLCDDGTGPVDFVSIGCPHLSLNELKQVAEYLEGKKIYRDCELQIWTDYPTKEMANVNGYTKMIEESGASLLTGSCPLLMQKESHRHATAMAMYGAKQAWSIRHQTKVPVYYGDIYQCIDTALNGTWEGRR